MGIKGFLSLFSSFKIKENLSLINYLFIDGYGFLFSILNSISRSNFSYLNLKLRIEEEIVKLQNLNFVLYFFIDGNNTQFKRKIKEKRKKEIKIKWKNYYSYYLKEERNKDEEEEEENEEKKEGKNNHRGDDGFPIPCLCIEQFIITLLSNKLPIYFCNGEADQEIALACKIFNESNQSAYCYSADRSFSSSIFLFSSILK